VPNRDDFPAVFARLKAVMQPYAPRLVVKHDAPDDYSLDAPPSAAHPNGLFFGADQIKKRSVSDHLMPVYAFPDLLDDLPDRLKKRMQGKSCFTFTALDDATLADLERLTAAGFARYRQERLA
jgi:hypothetical protein